MVQVHHGEGVAIHIDPESCAAAREGNSEALTGERAGQPLSRESTLEPRRSIEQPCHLLWTEHHRQLARLTDERRVLDDIVPLKRNPEEEPQRGLKYKAALSVAYGAGLRASEVVSLKVCDIDSKRMLIRVEQG